MSEVRDPSECVSIATLHELFTCHPSEGELRWRVARGKARPGKVAGYVHPQLGHRLINIKCQRYLAQRIMWAMVVGEWPPVSLWFKNGDGTDIRFENLMLHPGKHRNLVNGKTSEVPGVCWVEKRQRWTVTRWLGDKKVVRWYRRLEQAEAAARRTLR